jgi:hypothetical protein
MNRRFFIVLLFVLIFPVLAGAKAIGPNVSEYRGKELKWEDGAYGYYVMFKSLLENLQADQGNPQADACKNSGTFILESRHVPPDAYVSDAFLIWSGAQPMAKVNDVTDSEVTLSFSSADGKISETQVVKGKKAYKISESAGFEYDSFKDTDPNTLNQSFFTYRVDVTEFFKNIHDKGRELGLNMTVFLFTATILYLILNAPVISLISAAVQWFQDGIWLLFILQLISAPKRYICMTALSFIFMNRAK